MSGGLALTALVLALATLQALLCAIVVAALMPVLRTRLEAAAMAGRMRVFLILASLPLLSGAVLVAAVLGPSIGATLGMSEDHCLVHLDHALHLCLLHLPRTAPSITVAAVVGLGAVSALSVLWRTTRLMLAGRRESRSLANIARPSGAVRWIESRLPLALTAGLFYPKVYVSTGMQAGLDDHELDAAIAHEQCHARERHALLKLVTLVTAMFHLPGTKRELVSLLDLACERRADEFAADTVSDRLGVASALVRAHRLIGEPMNSDGPGLDRTAATMAFARSSRRCLDQRVHALLTEAPHSPPRSRATWLMGIGLSAATIAYHELHHAAEHLLALLG